LQQLSIQTGNDAAASSLKDISATPLALARICLANAAAPLCFASGETQGELDSVSAEMEGVCFA